MRLIAIDPGATGAIAIQNEDIVKVVKMPADVTDLQEFFNYLASIGEYIGFLEDVQTWRTDNVNGKYFGTGTMKEQKKEVMDALVKSKIEFCLVHPATWPAKLHLKVDKTKYQFLETKEEQDKERRKLRKALNREFAEGLFPQVKMIDQFADALCILEYAQQRMRLDEAGVIADCRIARSKMMRKSGYKKKIGKLFN